MTNDETNTIVVAGGGLVSLVLALAVKTQLDLTPHVFDKAASLVTEGHASVRLSSRALRVLQDISPTLLQGVRGVATKCNDDNDNDDEGLCIIPSRVQMILYSFARQQGIHVQKKTSVQRVDANTNGTTNLTISLGNGTTRMASLLLQADGGAALRQDDNDAVVYTNPTDIDQGFKDAGALVRAIQTHCFENGQYNINAANLAKAMTMYKDIRVNGVAPDAAAADTCTLKKEVGEDTEDESKSVDSLVKDEDPVVQDDVDSTASVGAVDAPVVPEQDKSPRASLKREIPEAEEDQPPTQDSLPDDISLLTYDNPAADDDISTLGESVTTNEFSLAPLGGSKAMIWPGVRRNEVKKSAAPARRPEYVSTVTSAEAENAVDYHFEVHSAMGSESGSARVYVAPHCSTDFGGRKGKVLNWLVDGISPHLKRLLVRPRKKLSAVAEAKVAAEWKQEGMAVVDEVQDILDVVHDADAMSGDVNTDYLKLPKRFTVALHSLVLQIADGYRDNPFHNFEHACNVTMAASHFLSRIASEKDAMLTAGERAFGLVSDPLVQFAIIFAALAHDMDHEGVPNAQLAKEKPEMAEKYKNKAIAEQHSVEMAFDVLLKPEFYELRRIIYRDEEEMRRFRRLVVNVVVATDIGDKGLKEQRNARYDKAFVGDAVVEGSVTDVANLKATVSIELLLQASDILHTMQPWEAYKSWNTRLFYEMYKAYADGRSDTDPSSFWFKGEIGFYDFYIIPLIKKMQATGAFGTMVDECLMFAINNKEEWLVQGEGLVNELKRKVTLIKSQRPTPSAIAA